MSPSCEFLSSVQKRYLGFPAALHTQPNGDLVEVSTVASKSCVVKSAPLPAPYYGAATGLGGRSSWLAKEAFDRALQVASP